jgi:hypothetical protein
MLIQKTVSKIRTRAKKHRQYSRTILFSAKTFSANSKNNPKINKHTKNIHRHLPSRKSLYSKAILSITNI